MKRTPEEEQTAAILTFAALVLAAVLVCYLIAAGY